LKGGYVSCNEESVRLPGEGKMFSTDLFELSDDEIFFFVPWIRSAVNFFVEAEQYSSYFAFPGS
jgi:hypothetical protein